MRLARADRQCAHQQRARAARGTRARAQNLLQRALTEDLRAHALGVGEDHLEIAVDVASPVKTFDKLGLAAPRGADVGGEADRTRDAVEIRHLTKEHRGIDVLRVHGEVGRNAVGRIDRAVERDRSTEEIAGQAVDGQDAVAQARLKVRILKAVGRIDDGVGDQRDIGVDRA